MGECTAGGARPAKPYHAWRLLCSTAALCTRCLVQHSQVPCFVSPRVLFIAHSCRCSSRLLTLYNLKVSPFAGPRHIGQIWRNTLADVYVRIEVPLDSIREFLPVTSCLKHILVEVVLVKKIKIGQYSGTST